MVFGDPGYNSTISNDMKLMDCIWDHSLWKDARNGVFP